MKYGIDSENVMDKESLRWLKKQVKDFVAVRATYETLAGKLREILEKARDRYAPLGRVDARAKSIASFAEKALRKRDKYDNPLERMTDLAGARIVTFTLDEARAVCRFIEHERGFRIDWKNSQDIRRRMKAHEFGYDGVHYVVELRQANILGVAVPPEVQSIPGKRSYKAEIQIHTMLQNAWSMIGHDRLYKTQVKVPEALKREVHALAATLESVDKEFARSVESLDRYIRDFEVYRKPTELQDDTEIWKAVHDEDPTDPEATYQLGRRLMAAQRWKEAYETLKALKDEPRADIQTDLGRSAWKAGADEEHVRGFLHQAIKLSPQHVRALCLLADTYRDSDLPMAIQFYEKAFALAPNEPAVLVPFVECHILRHRSLKGLELMRGSLAAALGECHERWSRGVYLPHAHFNCARLHLYLGEPYVAISSYTRAVLACPWPHMICDELNAVKAILGVLTDGPEDGDKLLVGSDPRMGLELARRLLIIALAAGAATWRTRLDEPGAKAWAEAGKSVQRELEALTTPSLPASAAFPLPVVIVAGGCDPRVERGLAAKYGCYLKKAFDAFSGTIISGGTTAGISGMVGKLKPSEGRVPRRIGYLPAVRPLPRGDKPGDSYEIRPSPGEDYNPAGVLRVWADILLQGIRPGQVRMLGIDGGPLTEFELRLGLAIGGVVGVAEDSGRAVETLLEEQSKCRPEGFVPLPGDGATWATFLRGASPQVDGLTEQQVELAARIVHEQFRKDNENNPGKHDPSVLAWGPKLPEAYRASSRHQVRFATLILDAVGYDVVPARRRLNPKKPPIPRGFEAKVRAMAELEHGRFCAERLVDGWRYGPEKDLKRKINPTIVPWAKLPKRIRQFDFDAVRNFPKWLAAAGLEIVPRASTNQRSP